MKKNILGEDGCINKDGKLGSTSYIFTVSETSERFWSNIESGIRPLVKVLVKHKIETFSSCQGHFNEEKNFNAGANVRYFTDVNECKSKYIMIKRAIKQFNNPNIISAEAKNLNKTRTTNRIEFLISPKERDKLNTLILEFSEYLEEYLSLRNR